MEELTDEIVLVVLDYMDSHSGPSRTKELLIATAEKLRQIADTIDIEKSAEKKAQLLALQTSQIDDLTIMCTNDVIDGLIHVCHSNGGHATELTKQGIQEVMQELGSITGSGRSSSKNNVEVIDLEETSVPVIGEAASSRLRQSVLSDEFHQKVKHAVSDALLKTAEAVSVHFSKTFEDITVEDLEVCAEQSSTSSVLVEEAASDIAETILEDLKNVSSQNGSVTEPAPSRNTFRAAAYRLYKKVHIKVFRFLLRLQESDSEKEENCLLSCSCSRASSSAALTSSTPVAEAVHRQSRNTAWGTINSSHEILCQLSDESITPKGPRDGILDILTWEYKSLTRTASSNSNDNFSVDPDPVTEKKTGLRFSKRLSRTFSAIRRALPNPFQCITGPP